MDVRPYRSEDCAPTREVFERAVHRTALCDYARDQVDAWARTGFSADESAAWGAEREASQTIVAIEGGKVIGFSDLLDGRVLDMLYVDPVFKRRGVATALFARVLSLAEEAGIANLETDASITARPFFERHGFVVVAEQTPRVRGVEMTNFKMRRALSWSVSAFGVAMRT
jgi:putative acetyltransferase